MFLSARIVRAVKAADVGPIIVSSRAAELSSKVASCYLTRLKAYNVSDENLLVAVWWKKINVEPFKPRRFGRATGGS